MFALVIYHILIHFSGKPKPNIRPKTQGEAFKLFITPDIVQLILTETNREADRKLTSKHEKRLQNDPNATRESWKPLTEVEFWAFLGLVIHAGVQKQADVPIRELFLDGRADPIYKATMSVNRFEEIKSFMRFDDRATREARKAEMGKLAPIKQLFDLFLKNLCMPYEPNKELTEDEQQFGFCGNCPVLQFNPSKPEKYGIKIFWICDAVNGYALNGKIYPGKENGVVSRDLGSKITKELAAPFYNTGRVLTMDNFFTSLPLVEFLAERKLTVVGTIRNNKADLPPEFKERRKRPLYSSAFAFRSKAMLVSYVAKSNKVVNLISSHHNSALVDSGTKFKPQVILYYNKTKIGVDLMNQKVARYTTARTTRRWPMAAVYNLVDIAGANADIIFEEVNPSGKLDHRRRFLKALALELTTPQMRARMAANARLPASIQNAMKEFGVEKDKVSSAANHLLAPQASVDVRIRCYRCTNDRKVQKLCQNCHSPVCNSHSRLVCEYCIEKADFS